MRASPLPAGAVKQKGVMLDGNGPCFHWMYTDKQYIYLDTVNGLVRVALGDLRAYISSP